MVVHNIYELEGKQHCVFEYRLQSSTLTKKIRAVFTLPLWILDDADCAEITKPADTTSGFHNSQPSTPAIVPPTEAAAGGVWANLSHLERFGAELLGPNLQPTSKNTSSSGTSGVAGVWKGCPSLKSLEVAVVGTGYV
ncbi:UNVERIFIED_CONTAM: hypothetical protein HDU68_011712 [Siphonaria sp. JEL0065]|nr:hypothetical protein HDU68_011712 [Siphonaria sp. JEL0065]